MPAQMWKKGQSLHEGQQVQPSYVSAQGVETPRGAAKVRARHSSSVGMCLIRHSLTTPSLAAHPLTCSCPLLGWKLTLCSHSSQDAETQPSTHTSQLADVTHSLQRATRPQAAAVELRGLNKLCCWEVTVPCCWQTAQTSVLVQWITQSNLLYPRGYSAGCSPSVHRFPQVQSLVESLLYPHRYGVGGNFKQILLQRWHTTYFSHYLAQRMGK